MLPTFVPEPDRPTYFELVAADRLMPSLKAALIYSLAVLAQRRPSLHYLLDYGDEAFAILTLLLERHSLLSRDASFAESLYGLKRSYTPPDSVLPAKPGASSQVNGDTDSKGGIPPRARLLSLIFLVGLPYVKGKFDDAFGTPTRNASLDDLGAVEIDNEELQVELREEVSVRGWDEPSTADSALADSSTRSIAHKLLSLLLRAYRITRALGKRVLKQLYPYLHAIYEGTNFGYSVVYLLMDGEYFSWPLHILGQRISRASPDDLVLVPPPPHSTLLHHFPVPILLPALAACRFA